MLHFIKHFVQTFLRSTCTHPAFATPRVDPRPISSWAEAITISISASRDRIGITNPSREELFNSADPLTSYNVSQRALHTFLFKFSLYGQIQCNCIPRSLAHTDRSESHSVWSRVTTREKVFSNIFEDNLSSAPGTRPITTFFAVRLFLRPEYTQLVQRTDGVMFHISAQSFWSKLITYV